MTAAHKVQLLLPSPLFTEGLTRILAEHFEMTEQNPDVLLIDAALMREAIVQPLLAENPDMKLVVLGDTPDIVQIGPLITAGVHAYARSTIGASMLIHIIELVLTGHAVWPNEVLRGLYLPPFRTKAIEAESVQSKLSPRELLLVDMLRYGHSNKEIARNTNIAEATVKVHVKAILRKLRVQNRTQIAVWAANRANQGEEKEAMNARSTPPYHDVSNTVGALLHE